MADVRLDFYDLDAEAVPDVCMRCGAPSSVRPMKTFSWMPYWARFMPYGAGLAFMKRRRVPVPLCDRHKNHWVMRYVVIFGGLAAFLLLFLLGGVLGLLCLAAAGLVFVALLVALIVFSIGQIGSFEITDDSIVLKNVSPEFTRAYREMTRGDFAPDVEDVARRRWGGREADYDEPPRRRRPPGARDLPPEDKFRRG